MNDKRDWLDNYDICPVRMSVQRFDYGVSWGVAIDSNGRCNAIRVPDAKNAYDALRLAAPILIEWATEHEPENMATH